MFTSYAQNFEDVILWRALKHVENGTYVDIGAQDPIVDSVSLGFYEHGWRGIHVEPVPEYAEKLRRARPDEEVIECVVGSEPGTTAFFSIPGSGLSTAEAENAQEHAAQGHAVERIDVRCIPLSELLDSRSDAEIHWLKIDVEGMEKAVIDGWLPSAVRPWIVVVESTLPTSPEVNFSAWEPQLLALGYEYVYFDGLNRFYVHNTRPTLKSHFGPGPNVFDGFSLSGLASAPFCHKTVSQLVESRHNLAASQAVIEDHLRTLRTSVQIIDNLNTRVADLHAECARLGDKTTIWNPMAPLRTLKRYLLSNIRRMTGSIRNRLFSAAERLARSRKLRRSARIFLRPFPRVEAVARSLVGRITADQYTRLIAAVTRISAQPTADDGGSFAALLSTSAGWKARKRLNV